MKKFLIASILLFCVFIGVSAQSKQDDITLLLKVMKSEKMIDSTMENMMNVLKQHASSQINGEHAQAKSDQYIEFVMGETKELSKKLVTNELGPLYDKYFTHEEIKDLIKFYKSPIGEKTLAISPQLSKELMEVMVTKYMPDFQQRIAERLNEIKSNQ